MEDIDIPGGPCGKYPSPFPANGRQSSRCGNFSNIIRGFIHIVSVSRYRVTFGVYLRVYSQINLIEIVFCSPNRKIVGPSACQLVKWEINNSPNMQINGYSCPWIRI